jgi:signal transduction histidine kinase
MHGGRDGVVSNTAQLETARMAYLRDVVSRLEGRIRELEENNKELTTLDQIKDDFIQLASHELRTPLTLITGYSKLIEDYPDLQSMLMRDQNAATLFHGLTEAIDRMQTIVEEILTVSRIITNRIELNVREMDLGTIANEVVESYAEVAHKRRLQVHFHRSDWPTIIYADPDLMRLTIDNLVSNAVKYTPDGGHIYLNCAFNGEIVQFSVRDTGIGIDRDKQEGIFKRMQQIGDVQLHSTSKTAFGGGGLGLGLSICHGIIEAHQGKIWVESEGYDRHTLPGSEFFVEVPIEQPNTPRRRTHILIPQQTNSAR